MSNVNLNNVQKHYGAFQVLTDIDLRIEPGEFVVMVGPSGCGKSTLLKAIAGLEEVSSGTIEIAGRDVTREEPGDRGIAMVFQSYALYPHMTVAENMGFGLRIMKRPKAEIDAAVQRAAEILRITEHLHKKPAQLSGGQRQRVAIGRAITRQPHVFLFDEPLSNLDAALRTQMRVELATLHKRLKATIIYVTHDQVEAMTMADRIVVLKGGRIEQVGAPLSLYHNPANQFVAAFLGAPRMNFLRGRVTALDTGATVAVEGLPPVLIPALVDGHGLVPGVDVTVGVRPEHVSTDPGAGHVATDASTRLTEKLGRETVIYADAAPLRTSGSDTGTEDVTLVVGEGHAPVDGARIRIGFAPANAYLFGPDGRTVSAPKSLTTEART